MSSYQDCIDTIRKAGGDALTDGDLEELLSALQARERYLRAKGLARDSTDAALQAADDLANNVKLAAVIEKRNAAINLAKRVEKVAWIQKHFGNNIAEGLEALLVGVNRAKQGAREGVAQVQNALRMQYLTGFARDLEATGHADLFASGTMDRQVSRALWAFGKDDEAAQLAKLPREAVELARVVNKWQEVSRVDANMHGAWIGKVDGYITRQSHDPEKIRGRGTPADYEAWKNDAVNYFDVVEMMLTRDAVDPENMFRGLWNDLASGNHLRSVPPGEISGFKGAGNLAKKMSQGRTVVFRDADAWFDYNAKYGTGNLRESVVAGLTHSAESTGMMQVLGTNPASMFETIKTDLVTIAKAEGKVDMVSKLQDKEGRLDNFMKAVDGSMNIPGNALWARRSANIRSLQMMAKLGGMIFSQLNDVAIYGSGARYHGRGFFSGMAEAVAGLGRSMQPAERRDLAASLGVALDNMTGELGRVGTFSEFGDMARATQLFMKFNLGNWWVSRMRTSAAFGMAHHMALQAERSWDAIGAEYQRVLSLYNITPEKWDLIRRTVAKQVDDKAYIVPEGVRRLTDDQVGEYLARAGHPVSEATIAAAKIEIEGNLRNYFVDQTSLLALEPDAKVRAIMLQGTRPGTWTGEMMRFMMQFKSFTGAYMQRIIGRELFAKGYEGDSLLGALRAGNGEFQGLAQLIVTSTLLGYGSLALKDLAKGKTPRDATDSPDQAFKIMLASMVQGGGAGIYGDFLFGSANRMGSGTIESLAGPVFSSAGRMVDLYHKALEGDDVAARAINEVINNTPFNNVVMTRSVLNYMIFYRMQEAMNPGYLRRMERNAEKEGQQFLISPSAAIN